MNTSSPAAGPAQRVIDKQMTGVIEAIMTQSYSLANRGIIPSAPQLAAYIAGLDEQAVLERIRKHPGAASTLARSADDAELLRWIGLIGH